MASLARRWLARFRWRGSQRRPPARARSDRRERAERALDRDGRTAALAPADASSRARPGRFGSELFRAAKRVPARRRRAARSRISLVPRGPPRAMPAEARRLRSRLDAGESPGSGSGRPQRHLHAGSPSRRLVRGTSSSARGDGDGTRIPLGRARRARLRRCAGRRFFASASFRIQTQMRPHRLRVGVVLGGR